MVFMGLRNRLFRDSAGIRRQVLSHEVELDDAVGGEADDAFGVVARDLEPVHPHPEVLVGCAYLAHRLVDVRKGYPPFVTGGEPAILVGGVEGQAADRVGGPSGPCEVSPFLEGVRVADLDPECVFLDSCHQAAVKSLVHLRQVYMKSAIRRGYGIRALKKAFPSWALRSSLRASSMNSREVKM